jgi:signal transduction histidine kinase
MVPTVTAWLRRLRPGQRQKYRPGTREHARRRLRLQVVASLLCLAIPLALLLSRVYAHLEREVFYQYRASAEEVVNYINQRLTEILHTEDNRAFDEYSFLKVAANPLLQGTTVTTSPLSALPPSSTVPGIIGYFQIGPDGSLHSPVLPELDDLELSANAERFGFSAAELEKRLALRHRLEQLLLHGTPVTQQASPRPAPVPASPLPAPTDPSEGAAREAAPAPGRGAFVDADAASSEAEGRSGRGRRDAGTATAPPATLDEALPQSSAVQKSTGLKSPPYRERRKEQVALPEQSTPSQVQGALERLKTLPPAAASRPVSRDTAAQEVAAAAAALQGRQQGAVKILTFESEVDPFQFTVLRSGPLVFFRKAWRHNLRYIQGFVADPGVFLQQLVETSVSDTTIAQLAALTVHYKGLQLLTVPATPPSRTASAANPVQPLYRASLDTPLEAVDLAFSVTTVPRSTGATVVDLLVLVLALVLSVGHYGLYRVGMQHIELAAQRSDFVAAVSHELKTPLTSIRMYGEMLRAGWVTDEGRRQSYYDFIFFESERLSRLITNVLQLARLTNQDTPLALQAYSLCQLLHLVRSPVSTLAEAAGFTLAFIEPEPPGQGETSTVLAEADAFVQICINLVDNAIKFSAHAAPPRIDIGWRLVTGRSSHAVFFVRDYGPGVARDQMQRIFQLFYRGENELTRHTQGTGIGLALVKALAAQMQARVELQNCHPGAEFRIVLPLLRQDAARPGGC